jgi:hypothetical protein
MATLPIFTCLIRGLLGSVQVKAVCVPKVPLIRKKDNNNIVFIVPLVIKTDDTETVYRMNPSLKFRDYFVVNCLRQMFINNERIQNAFFQSIFL